MLLIFICLIFVSGCIGGGNNNNSFGTGVTQSNSGVTFDISGIPPKISSASQFDLEVTATNLGSYSLQPGDVLLTLSNTKQFDFTLESDEFQTSNGENGFTNAHLLIKSLDVDVAGDSNRFYFSNLDFKSDRSSVDIPVPISINTCYFYNTLATLDICVAKDITSDICSSTEMKKVLNQAAPVHVSGFKQESSLRSEGTRIDSNVIIHISSYSDSSLEAYVTDNSEGIITTSTLAADRLDCSNSATERYKAVRLKSIQVGSDNPIGGEDIDKYCSVSVTPNIIRLDEEGKASISCTLPLTRSYSETRGDYVERMAITLDYLVSDSVTKSLTVVGT